nr:hypothetical protein [Ralstonia sp. UBA689]
MSVTALPIVVTFTAAPATAVPAVFVVMFAGADARFVAVKLNVPVPPTVVVLTFTVDRVLVRLHVIAAPPLTLVAGIVTTLPANEPKLPSLPVTAAFASVQLAPVSTYPAAGVSVSVTALPIVVTFTAAPATAVPAVFVVMLAGADARFVAVKLNVPVPPTVVLLTFTVGYLGKAYANTF